MISSDNFIELTQKLEVLKAEIQKEGKNILHSQLQNVFESDPHLVHLRWAQYTPYFNDGDTCVFGVRGVEAVWNVNGEEIEVDWIYGEPERDPDYVKLPEESKKTYLFVSELENFLGNNLYLAKELFGDHVEVTATREGIEVDEYEHE